MLAPARDAAMALPEVTEAVAGFGHISFRVRDKPFVLMGENADGPWLCVKSDTATQAFLVKRPEFEKTPYIGRHGWINATQVPPADWTELVELISDAYMLVAPKRLVREAQDGRGSGD